MVVCKCCSIVVYFIECCWFSLFYVKFFEWMYNSYLNGLVLRLHTRSLNLYTGFIWSFPFLCAIFVYTFDVLEIYFCSWYWKIRLILWHTRSLMCKWFNIILFIIFDRFLSIFYHNIAVSWVISWLTCTWWRLLMPMEWIWK